MNEVAQMNHTPELIKTEPAAFCFITGGAYQGKLDYVLTRLAAAPSIDPEQAPAVFTCQLDTQEIDFSYPVIDKLHLLVWSLQQQGRDALQYLIDHRADLNGHWLICDDVSSGVVPIDEATRRWRESTGRCSVWLAREAAEVQRLFCGLATCLKP